MSKRRFEVAKRWIILHDFSLKKYSRGGGGVWTRGPPSPSLVAEWGEMPQCWPTRHARGLVLLCYAKCVQTTALGSRVHVVHVYVRCIGMECIFE